MSARLFYDKDCSLEPLRDKTMVFVGFGNQGRAQANNLRDTLDAEDFSSWEILIANQDDSYKASADKDGFSYTSDWADAASRADVLFLLVPDQVYLIRHYIYVIDAKLICDFRYNRNSLMNRSRQR